MRRYHRLFLGWPLRNLPRLSRLLGENDRPSGMVPYNLSGSVSLESDMKLVQCNQCGEVVAINGKRCPNCGNDLEAKGWKRAEKISAASPIVAGLAAVIALGVLSASLGQFFSNEKWKQKEFIDLKIKDFHKDRINEDVLRMLDHNPASVELSGKKEDVYYNTLISAVSKDIFDHDEQELKVKQLFEHFISSLSEFQFFTENIIDPGILCLEFGYPIGILNGDEEIRKEKLRNSNIDIKPLADAVRDYLQRWNNTDVPAFMEKVEHSCKSSLRPRLLN